MDVINHYYDTYFTLAHPVHPRDESVCLNWGTPLVPVVSVVLYLIMVFTLPKIMKNRQPFSLKTVVALWNLMLSLFSIAVFFGVFVPYIQWYSDWGFYNTFCGVGMEQQIFGTKSGLLFWSYLFAISKYFELLDTFFLIIRKKPLSFLHWFHHATVLLYTWFAEYTHLSLGFVFIVVNAFVHSFMYFYYYLSEIGKKPSEKVALFITIIQISQMVFGIGAVGTGVYLWYQTGVYCLCDTPELMLVAAFLMYGTYLFLFLQFFVNRYFRKKSASARPGTPRPPTKTTPNRPKKE